MIFLNCCDPAWVKLRNEKERAVRITLRRKNVRYVDGGQVMAKKGCWSLLKGGFIVNVSAPVDISFKVKLYIIVSSSVDSHN